MLFPIFAALLSCIFTLGSSQSNYIAGVCIDDTVRLFNGTSAVLDNGIVQICKNGVWNEVCDYNWNQCRSKLLCKELGYGIHTSKLTYI